MARNHVLKATVVAALAGAALLLIAPAQAALPTPVLGDPGPGARVEALPAFSWNPVPGAETYEFQVAADRNFNSPVLGRGEGSFSTRNTRATLKKTLPNGTYWWRVRASSKSGDTSPWTTPRSLVKSWTASPISLSPASGFGFAFPGSPIKLNWSAVPYAASYHFALASDPNMANIVENQGKPVETWATNYVPTFTLLPSGTYYWNVTPADSQGNRGAPSPVASFSWTWPSQTSPRVTDLMTATEMFDPQFSWDPVAGATKYEVEVNSSSDFAPGSKVCCSQLTISTSLAPTVVFKDNTYYWRVRALDAAGNAGVWNIGPSFTKTFDKVPPVDFPSLKNLHMRDHLADPGTDLDLGTAGYQTEVPILAWDPVPGASSYFVEVAPYTAGSCFWGGGGSWRVNTSVPWWTPLGGGWNQVQPYPVPGITVAAELTQLVLDQDYCARVRARGERDSANQEVFGDFTYLGTGPAFQWIGYPAGGACTPSCNTGYLGANDYVLPARGSLTTKTPLFTWRPIAGRLAYFVIVAKDPSFSNVVDYAFTRVPAYAPRNPALRPTTYSDETTLYYWAVLPAANANGSGAVGDPLAAAASNFQKQSVPPSQISPADGSLLTDQPVFRWTPVEGARRYRFQVGQEPTFAAPLEDVVTASTSYTPFTTHPADTTLYWRVRADDENLIGLTWSAVRTFQRRLPTPTLAGDNLTVGDFTPAWTWSHVSGASGYTFSMDGPDGSHKEWPGLRMPAAAFVYLFGPGIWRWRVRAEFPKLPAGTVNGPWSSYLPFTRTLSEPSGVRTSVSGTHLLFSWNWKLGAKNFKVQVSQRPDFAANLEEVETDNTSYAPNLLHPFYQSGGSFWWRVAAMDKARNVGDFSPAQRIDLLQRLRVVVSGRPLRRRWARLTVIVSNPSRRPVAAATVTVSGAGVRARRGRTNRVGRVTFRVRPTKRGRLVFSAKKAGFGPGALSLRIR